MVKGEFKSTGDGRDPQQAAVDAALERLAERTLEANERRGDTRDKDRKAATAHQATVDRAIAQLNERTAAANAQASRDHEKARQAALAHQRRVDDAIAGIVWPDPEHRGPG